MNRKLIKIYILIFISYVAVSMNLPNVFPKSYKVFNNFRLKVETRVKSEKVAAFPVTEGKINLMFIMDDGWETQYTVGYNLLKKYGIKANISVIPSLVGENEYMTLDQLSDMYINGWDMLNHTYNHYYLNDLNLKQKIKEFNKGRKWLVFHEFTRAKDDVVFPGGYYNKNTIDVLKSNNYKSARSLGEVWNISSEVKGSNVDIINLDSSVEALWAMDSINDALDKKRDIIFVLHKLEKVTTNTGMQYDPQRLEEILNYINAKREKVNVVTYSQWLNIRY